MTPRGRRETRNRSTGARAIATALAAVGLLLWAVPAAASTYVVDLPGDFGDSTPGDDSCAGGPGGCSLRAAVEEANAHGGPDIVDLPPNDYELNLGGPGSLVISSEVVIDGTGSSAATTIRPAPPGVGRLIDVSSAGDLVLRDATVRGATLADSGAGIRSAGALTLRRAVVADNEANNADGGGIATLTGSGPTLIADSVIGSPDGVIPGNRAGGLAPFGVFGGGGISQGMGAGTLTIQDSRISLNTVKAESVARGGGIYGGSAVNISDSEVSGNVATVTSSGSSEGGMVQYVGPLTMRRTTVSGNSALATGGGSGAIGGVGIETDGTLLEDSTIANNTGRSEILMSGSGTEVATVRRSTIVGADDGIGTSSGLVLENSTVSGSGSGNGVTAIFGGAVSVDATTVSGYAIGLAAYQPTSTATVRGSIVADNGLECEEAVGGTISSAGGNVDEGDDCGFSAAGDLTNTDPLLAPLADNGGLTETRSIPANSPAVDNFAAGCPPPGTDQRGLPRPQGIACDSGAFEFADTEVSGPDVDAKKKQKQKGKTVKVKVKAGAQEPVDLVGKGRITVKGKNRKFNLKKIRKSTDAGRRTILRLTPKRKRDNKKIFKLLKKGKDLRANPSVKLTDATGNSVTEVRVVRLKPKP
jgi:hypothetical protein